MAQSFRETPPKQLAGINIAGLRDYAAGTNTNTITGQSKPLLGPTGDLVILDLADEGNYVAVRPSGTEPKIKLYVFTRLSPEESADVEAASQALTDRVEQLEKDVRDYAKHHA